MTHKKSSGVFGCRKALKAYITQTAGAIVIAFALVTPVVMGAMGMALDFSRAYLVQQRLAQAIDAAAIAAAASSADPEIIEQKVQEFFEANYPPEKLGITFDPEVEVDGDVIRVTGTAQYYTSFVNLIGIEEIFVSAATEVVREVRGLEVALVLDLTGSMQGSKITSLRTATLDFIEIIFDRVSDPEYLKVGIVPYAIAVNVGSIAPTLVSNPPIPSKPVVVYNPNSGTQWAGCVMARNTPHDKFDTDEIDGGSWSAYWWAHKNGSSPDGNGHNPWDPTMGGSVKLIYPNSDNGGCNDRRSPNLGCPVQNPITPLTNDEEALVDAAEKITHWCRGGTAGNLGMVWGWRVLSPTEPFTEGAEYDSPYWRKAVVMMTDGENTFYNADYSSYGYISEGRLGTTNKSAATTIVNNRFAETCDEMKALGITVYTVIFGSGIIGTPTAEYYRDCASDDTKFFPAATNAELIEVFGTISRELSNLHIRG
jgi:Flp pilus assembly protein TadG